MTTPKHCRVLMRSVEGVTPLRPHRLRIAFAPDLGGFAAVDAEVERHLRRVLTGLSREGATIEESCPDLTGLERTYHCLRSEMFASVARRMPDEIRRHFKATLAENVAFGEALTMADIADAQLDRSTIYNRMLRLFETYDVLACPTAGCMPHPQEEERVREVGAQPLSGYMDWLRFAFLATVAGLPAISVPVGMQLIGKPRGEAALLAAARVVEIHVGGPLGPIDPVIHTEG